MPEKSQVYIGGQWLDSSSGETIEVINPANQEVVGVVPKCGPAEVDQAVAAAAEAGPAWAAQTYSDRSKLLLKLSQLIMANHESLAVLETQQHGSPIRKTMNFDVPISAEQLEYFAGVGRGITGDTLPMGPWCLGLTMREPLGVVGLITPWNFPALMVAWKLGAALISGNTCVIKPPSICPLTTVKLAQLAEEAGIPAGVVNVITGPGETVGEALVTHPKVAKISFTGDTATGKRIINLASRNVTQLGLELGGKNAFVVLPDVDVDAAVEGAVYGCFFNSGQVCASASRLYIHESIYDQFAEKLVQAAQGLRLGDPMNPETVIGPVAYEEHRNQIEAYVEGAKQAGATLLLGGSRPDTPETKDGFFVAPTIFGDCNNQMEFMRREIFGPVVGLSRFSSPEEAVVLANDTDYGLSASVWTRDARVGLVLAGQIDAGTVWINDHLVIFCETPWGGCKQSGWGKEGSHLALEEYTRVKHVYLDLTGAQEKPWYGLLK